MKKLKLSIFLIVVLLITIVTIKQQTYLEISHENQIKYITEVKVGDSFDYSSIHSVSMTTLIETIVIGNNQKFIAMKVKYTDQGGAGMPEFDYGESEFYIEDGYFVIDNMNRVFETLSFQVEPKYENNMVMNGNEIQLFDLIKDKKGSVELVIKKTSFIVFLVKRLVIMFV